jgi:dipeptidyl aminopeptidase/acylaminoacyl peptidase
MAAETYRKPSREILEVLHAPAPPASIISPIRSHVLLLERRLYPPISELAAPVHRVAGLRINPATNGPHSSLYFTSLSVKRIDNGREIRIDVPADARLDLPKWSPDGQLFAVTNTTDTGIELYLGSVEAATPRCVAGIRINDTLETPFQWLSGSSELLVQTVPADRDPAPVKPAAPEGPNVQEAVGRAGPVRTFQDMLASPFDEQLFDYYCSSQLIVIDAGSLAVASLGAPAIFRGVQAAPDAKHFLIHRIVRPYSYLHPYSMFPMEAEIWDRSGSLVYKIASLPLEDKVPIEGVPVGPRAIGWRPTEAATLVWWEALDDGDPRKKVSFRDRLVQLRAPFAGAPAEITRTEHRAAGLIYGANDGLAFAMDYDRDRRWIHTFQLFLDDPEAPPRLAWSRSIHDRYGDPGQLVMNMLPNGSRVIHQSGDSAFLSGMGATPEGDRPFLDRLNLTNWKTERLFHASDEGFEQVIVLLNEEASRFLTSYESPREAPNLFLRTTGSSGRTALTCFGDPTPQLRSIKRQLVTYMRDDGVQLSFTLFLPPGHKEGTRLPTLLWAYPLEYTDVDTAGQIGGSPQRYVQMRGSSHLFLLLAGYAVLNDATIPIIGDPETVNNTYVEQLTAGARAAIDKATEMGVTDPDRVGVMGHSYGGFMTANLLAHTKLFRAGVARSGAYNRTLTPFGFQSERRTYWEAPEIYTKVSPFHYADRIKEPLLLIHGEVDNNPGTFPIQSERLYQAIRGNGGTVRLLMLPFEAHGYAARESIETVLAETIAWFDRYVRNAPAAPAP